MGYYIQIGSLNKSVGIKDMGGQKVSRPTSFSDIPLDKALVVVVDNGGFEAAVLVYSPEEFKAFTLPHDSRPKEFFLLDKETAHKAAGFQG